MGFSRLLPSILSDCVCGSANIASKGVPGTLKPFLRTWKSVFSTFWKDVVIVSHVKIWKTRYIPQIRQFGSWRHDQGEKHVFRCWVLPEGHRWAMVCQKTEREEKGGFQVRLAETLGLEWELSARWGSEGKLCSWGRFCTCILGRLNEHCLIDYIDDTRSDVGRPPSRSYSTRRLHSFIKLCKAGPYMPLQAATGHVCTTRVQPRGGLFEKTYFRNFESSQPSTVDSTPSSM